MIGKYPVYFPIKQLLQINIELNVLLFTSVSFFKQSSAGAAGMAHKQTASWPVKNSIFQSKMSRYNPIEQMWSAVTQNLHGNLLQLDDQTESEDRGYVSQSEAEVEAEQQHQEADSGHEEEVIGGEEGSEGVEEDASNST